MSKKSKLKNQSNNREAQSTPHKSKSSTLKSTSRPPVTSQLLTHNPQRTQSPPVQSSSSIKPHNKNNCFCTLNPCHHSIVPQQPITTTRKRNRTQPKKPPHPSAPLPIPSLPRTPQPGPCTTPSQPSLRTTTKKNKKIKKKAAVTTSPQPSLPNPNPLASETTIHSTASSPLSPLPSPSPHSETCQPAKPRKRSRDSPQLSIPRNHLSENHKPQSNATKQQTHKPSHVTSSVAPKSTNHESHTSTPPPVHRTKSPYPSPPPTSSQRYSLQSHPQRITHPTPLSSSFSDERIPSDARVDPEHPSVYNHSNMPRNHDTWFHVGTNPQQPRSRIQHRNHAGTPSHRATSALERTYPNAWKRKRNLSHVRSDQFSHANVFAPRPSGYFCGFQQQPTARNAPFYPVRGDNSARQPHHRQENQQENPNQPTRPQNSVNTQLGQSSLQNVTRHHANRGSTHYAPTQHRSVSHQPSQGPDAMQIDRPVQATNMFHSVRSSPQNSTVPAISRQSRTTPFDQPNRHTKSNVNAGHGQGRRKGANASSQLTAGQPSSSMKARSKLQKKVASPTGEYYGIRCGRDGFSGVATCWQSCSVFVVGYRDAVYQLFDTWEKAERFSDRYGTGASITHRSNFRHIIGCRRNGVMQQGSTTRLPWEHENEPQVVSLVVGAAWLRFGIGSGIGGYGVFLSSSNPYNCAGLMEGNVTEMRLQLKGLLEALEIVYQHRLVKDGGTVELYTASQEVKNGIDHWLGRWDRSGQWVRDGKPVGSQDLWRAILKIQKELLKKGTKIHTIWIRRPNRIPALQEAVNLARVVFSGETRAEGQKQA